MGEWLTQILLLLVVKKLTVPARATDRFNIDIFPTFFSLIGSTNMV